MNGLIIDNITEGLRAWTCIEQLDHGGGQWHWFNTKDGSFLAEVDDFKEYVLVPKIKLFIHFEEAAAIKLLCQFLMQMVLE